MEYIISLIIQHSKLHGIDPDISLAVAQIESKFDHKRIGELGEIGVFQLRPEYFPVSIVKLESNIKHGIKYLAYVKKYCGHQLDNTWVICYNLGVQGASKIKYPRLFNYYKKHKEAYDLIRERKRANRFYSI
jgi:soluble lytic murein transglycosylase-like protein